MTKYQSIRALTSPHLRLYDISFAPIRHHIFYSTPPRLCIEVTACLSMSEHSYIHQHSLKAICWTKTSYNVTLNGRTFIQRTRSPQYHPSIECPSYTAGSPYTFWFRLLLLSCYNLFLLGERNE